MGDVYTLGEAYAFGVIWSFVFKTLAMVVLRFKDKSPREYEVPLNVRLRLRCKVPRGELVATAVAGDHIDLPVGITIVFLLLLSTATVNLFTRKVATVWGWSSRIFVRSLFICAPPLPYTSGRYPVSFWLG